MKKLSVGDKVRFLSTVGGGTVKGFLNKQLVMVEDEHGFDVPVMISECVVVEASGNEMMGQAAEKEELIAKEKTALETPEAKVTVTDIPEETREGEQITACLAFLPTDVKNLTTTGYECYFVNDSNYWLFFNYMSRENNSWKSRYSGSVEPNTKIFLEEFGKEQLNELEKVSVQFIAFKHNKPFRFKNPCSVELRIDTVKFYKLHSFRENDYFEEDALLFYIIQNDQPEREMLISAGEIEKAIREKEAPERRPRIQRIEKREKNAVVEVDLHINQLLDTTAGMSNADVLEYQLQKFNEAMSANQRNKNQKIVFIHGKGDGVLKKTIISELKKRYPTCYHQDASFQEYGYGATMVTIK
ncbi:MAG: DUF2027 domain-containing protein [Proteiniphilum sp.]|jgi:hypothetical protein|nr:DUF2027 domain-containing protein [Proteiniphilum sp.]NCD13634.1 DUF2027 domain-containing protein [Bacteroidia bacterium]HHT34301.1 DUF2027 domain-containing protein [Bacteroidales bacterium]MDD3332007.1 DUF2027 domain-containing protein [Proteiniphilum sp.]MDD3555794.1 DUF2027 domain-containing protein [Proteiniphilum sp.]